MKCSKCELVAEFICPCQYLIFCPNHIGLHLIEIGDHSSERLNITFNSSEFYSLKIAAMARIQEIKMQKCLILSIAKTLIMDVENCSKIATNQLDTLCKLYTYLISFQKVSKSLKTEAQKIQSTKMKIKVVSVNITSYIQETFNNSLIIFEELSQDEQKNNELKYRIQQEEEAECKRKLSEDKKKKEEINLNRIEDEQKRKEAEEKRRRNQIQRKKKKDNKKKYLAEENKRKEEIEFKRIEGDKSVKVNDRKVESESKYLIGGGNIKVEKRENFLSNIDVNSFILGEKQDYMESLDIKDYNTLFLRVGECKFPLIEIKFSNDSKYSFNCKNYLGIFK